GEPRAMSALPPTATAKADAKDKRALRSGPMGGARLAHAGLASLVGWPNKVLVVVLLIELGQ
ncbi:MAG: hypothetical protein WBZ23_15505, partial [Pseudolabrys sp.]